MDREEAPRDRFLGYNEQRDLQANDGNYKALGSTLPSGFQLSSTFVQLKQYGFTIETYLAKVDYLRISVINHYSKVLVRFNTYLF